MKKYQDDIQNRMTARLKKAFKLSGKLKGKKVLDIGCGIGWFEKMALESGCREVVGIEPFENKLNEARKQVSKAVFKKASVLKLPFKSKYFDVVTMFDVIEHLPKGSEKKALKEIARVLKPGGRLIISTPNCHWLSQIMDPAWYFGHRHYSFKDLEKLLTAKGFKVKRVEYGGKVWDLLSLDLFYLFKLIGFEVPNKSWWEVKREKEYQAKDAFGTLFIEAII